MDIEHVVVLMLENRSFDCMLGGLYPDNPMFDGLTGSESNIWHKPDGTQEVVPVWNDPDMTLALLTTPSPDTGELFADIAVQIGGIGTDPSPMGGFVDNYMRLKPGDAAYDKRAAMHYFTPDQVPALSQLAQAFGVSDQWFCSAPNQTWPNRFFVHTGTANGYVNNSPPRFPYTMETVFGRLSSVGKSWTIYYSDFPQSATLAKLWSEVRHFSHFDRHFAADAARGALPAYSFIEPRYFADEIDGTPPNDGHPPHNVAFSQQLIAQVYNALRSGPKWDSTLLIVTCDEHGGCYDHVVPPAATPPGGQTPDGFAFDRFGVRVPTVIVSPHVPAGSILRAAGSVPFDHTSIIATLRALHGFEPLTPRDAAAPSVLDVLDFGQVNNGPESIPVPASPVFINTRASINRSIDASDTSIDASGLQLSLHAVSTALPLPYADIDTHCENLASAPPIPPLVNPTAAQAKAGVVERFQAFLRRGEIRPAPLLSTTDPNAAGGTPGSPQSPG